MPKCPKCGQQIAFLTLYEEAERRFDLGCTPNGEPTFIELEPRSGGGRQTAECPQCHEELFDDEDDAAKWLAGLIEWPVKDKA